MIDPMPELPGSHTQFALGHANFGERARDLGAGCAGEADGASVGDATTWDARAAAVMIRLLAWRAPGEKHSGEAADGG